MTLISELLDLEAIDLKRTIGNVRRFYSDFSTR